MHSPYDSRTVVRYVCGISDANIGHREEGMAEGENNHPTNKFWSIVGALSGGAMGFIMANAPGAIAGAVAGNRLGAVRDSKGKSVYAVFNELDQPAKMRMLSELASKVFAHAIS